MATFAVGDIHGCLDLLRRLLDNARFDDARDRLWIVGDVVGRGAQSLETLRWLHRNRAMITMVLGNHDLHLLAAHAGVAVARARADDGMGEVLRAGDGDDLCGWLRTMPLAYRQGNHLMVHAGVLPLWDADEVVHLAAEVAAVIGGDGWLDFAAKMYGDMPDRWSAELQGVDRWRVVVNALTRLRVCADDGAMMLGFSGSPSAAPMGSRPWFDMPDRKTADVVMVCGHWAALGFVQRHDLLALDSGAAWGGRLTMVRLDDGAVFSCHA